MEHKKERHFFYILLALSAIITIAVFRPYLTILVLGAAFAVVLYPVFLFIKQRLYIRQDGLAAFFTLIFFLIILGVPLYFLVSQAFSEAQSVYLSFVEGRDASAFINQISHTLTTAFPPLGNINLSEKLDGSLAFIAANVTNIFGAALGSIFSFILMLIALFAFLKDGRHYRKYVMWLSPLSTRHDERILSMLERAINGVMKGYVLIALAQGLLMGIGLWIFGVPNPALWGMFAGITAMIPSVGTAIVSIPAILYLLFIDNTGAAIGLTLWSVILVGLIDNGLSPVLVGKKIELPALVILFSVLGGLALFGAAGIILGPLTISLFYTLATIYKEDFNPSNE